MPKKKYLMEVDGRKYEATFIGKGQYSRVYRIGDRVVMYTRGDCAKEVLAMYTYDRMAHLPELVRHENITVRPGVYWYVFSSPFYRDVCSSDTSAWKLMKEITRLYGKFWDVCIAQGIRKVDIYMMQKFVEEIRGMVPNSVVKALREIVEVTGNCSDKAGFDFQKSNFGVNEYGTLMFRDVVFVME